MGTRHPRILLFLSMLLFSFVVPDRSAPGTVSEYGLKAAYLFNFAKFVEWPSGAFRDESAPLQIGILGEDPFGDELDKVVTGKLVGKHPIRVRRFATFNRSLAVDLQKCHILFIAYSEKGRVRDILASLEAGGVLTVSEIERFPVLGGMISFDQVGKKITLLVNPGAAQKAHLSISARLLQVSRIYKGEKP